MPNAHSIVAIARDPALLRSLAFALQAHGYDVAQFRSWRAARESAAAAACVIVDGCLPAADQKACLDIIDCGVGVVLLAEDDTPRAERAGLRILHKPLSGPDVLAALASLHDAARKRAQDTTDTSQYQDRV